MTLLVLGFLSGSLGAWGIMKYGGMIGINDIPSSRSSHSNEIPKGGGVGILTAFILISLLLSVPLYLWIPGSVLSVVSFWGDRFEIHPLIRLLIQFICASIFLWGFFRAGQTVFSGLLFLPLSIFIAGTSNFYNFMDGIDGIAGITGCSAFFLFWIFMGLNEMNGVYGMFSIAMAASCIGFLLFNTPRARVFMGDVGSILLGFTFSSMMVSITVQPLDFFILTGFLLPFYFDEIFTMLLRIKNRESLLKPHRKHIYQLLANELGLEHWKISAGYAVLQILAGLALITAGTRGYPAVFTVYGLFCTLFLFIALHVWKKVNLQ